MIDANENLRNWLLAKRGDEYRVFARLEWEELRPDGWTAVKEHLTEQDAVAEMMKLAPPEKRD
jgi:hypothetical protein